MIARALPWGVFIGVAAIGGTAVLAADDGDVSAPEAPGPPTADALSPGASPPDAGPAAPAAAAPPAPEGLVLPFGMTWDQVTQHLDPEPPVTGISPTPIRLIRDPPSAEVADPQLAWETSLSAREQALVRTQQALLGEMQRLDDLQKKIESRWSEASEARRFAETACGGPVITAGPATGALPLTADEREVNLNRVAEILKKMKASKAAEVAQEWDDVLAIDVLGRLSARVVTPILSAMPAEVSGRLTRRMISGPAAVRANAARPATANRSRGDTP